ncbi:beta-1,3-galactosyltransferase 1-like [Lutzomyia longipalpis]|uniref:Hexosyltransferase n=1 Tax=Lutzomyia longipalpis TaxID=7200 RepID=A0A7G3ACU1_LUTLO|nr:beta-1,3-galactosyltransferase 1-like [Lutzomyia longipalpis]
MSPKRASLIVGFVSVTLVVYVYLFITWQLQYVELTRKKRQDFYNLMSWQSRNLTDFIQPDHRTCLICPKVPDVCRDGREANTTIFFVTTSPTNREKRDVIRSTWAQKANPKPFFVTGHIPDSKTMNLLEEEARLYNDIVVEDFVDTYVNLTLKTGFMFKNFLSICPKAKYMMKCDDDVMVNPNVVEALVAKVAGPNKPLIGRLFVSPEPFRDIHSKYYIPYWLYDKPLFPPYLSGPGYLVPGESVQKILEESFKEPLINLEDVFFTGIIAMEKLNMTLQNSKRFFTYYSMQMGKCAVQKAALLHHLEDKEMLDLWNEIWNGKLNCSSKHQGFRSVLSGIGIPPFFLRKNSLDLE